MKLNSNYILRNVAGSDVVVAIGEEAAKLGGMITLNETAALIWKCLEDGDDEAAIVARLRQEYAGADEATLKNDLQFFLDKLRQKNILTDD